MQGISNKTGLILALALVVLVLYAGCGSSQLEKLSSLKKENDELKVQLTTLNNRIGELQEKLGAGSAELENVTKQLEQLKTENEALAKNNTELKGQNQLIEEKNTQLTEELKKEVVPEKVKEVETPKEQPQVKKLEPPISTPNRAFLGVEYAQTGSDLGLLIGRVFSDSAAERAGLKAGDIIKQFDNKQIMTRDDLVNILKDKKPGDEVKIVFLRKGSGDKYEEKETIAKLGERKAPSLDMDQMRSLLQRLQGQGNLGLKPSLGVSPDPKDSEDGYLIGQVEPGSPADQAGLKPGDLIIEFDWDPIMKKDDLNSALEYLGPGDEVEIIILRDGKEMKLTAKLAEKKQPE